MTNISKYAEISNKSGNIIFKLMKKIGPILTDIPEHSNPQWLSDANGFVIPKGTSNSLMLHELGHSMANSANEHEANIAAVNKLSKINKKEIPHFIRDMIPGKASYNHAYAMASSGNLGFHPNLFFTLKKN